MLAGAIVPTDPGVKEYGIPCTFSLITSYIRDTFEAAVFCVAWALRPLL